MNNDNKVQNRDENAGQQGIKGNVKNPFENGQTVEKDIEQSQEELENEQQFKEAQTERD